MGQKWNNEIQLWESYLESNGEKEEKNQKLKGYKKMPYCKDRF